MTEWTPGDPIAIPGPYSDQPMIDVKDDGNPHDWGGEVARWSPSKGWHVEYMPSMGELEN